MAGSCADHSQWLSMNEDSLFLHDGLIRVTDLVELPEDVNRSSDTEHEVITFDTKNATELSDRILSLCGTQNNAYARLLEYRLNALRGLWNAQRQVVHEQTERENANQEEAMALLKKQGIWHQSEHTSFASRLSLLLVYPLLQSQSKTDDTLCNTTTQLLLQCLKECPPHSLSKEPGDCLNGLEDLLCTWLGEGSTEPVPTARVRNPKEKETAASALVALASARGSMRSFVHTIHLLQNLPDIASLPVAGILSKLLELEGGAGCWSSLLGSKHVICWGFEDMLQCPGKKDNVDKEKDVDYGRSLACDGKFLYTTNSAGQGLSKIGSGFCGTLRGFVYIKNNDLGPGRVAWGNDLLLMRPHEFDSDKDVCRFAIMINPYTLKIEGQFMIHPSVAPKSVITTIQFCSDGQHFYWVWCPGSATEKTVKGQSVYLDIFSVMVSDVEVLPIQKRIILQRKDEACNKSFNEALLSRLRPYRPATTASLMVLSGSSTSAFGSSQEASGTTTSCGLPLKTLLRAPIYTCGNLIVILSSTSASSSNVTARSLFGSGSSLAGLRSLATNLCFSVKDGLFVNRSDLIDAPTCGLARGALLQGLGICYDAINNMIWTCSNDWIDQFCNPGHQAIHHIHHRLGINPMPCTPPPNDHLTPQEVIRQLLQHVGSMCCHQMVCDLLHMPLSSVLVLQQQNIDFPLWHKMLDILEVSIRAGDDQIICCSLVVLQLILRSFKLDKSCTETGLMTRTSGLLWQLLVSPRHSATFHCINFNGAKKWLGVQAEACNAICAGFNILYPDPAERNALLLKLLSNNCDYPAFSHLRDLILFDCTEQLQSIHLEVVDARLLQLEDELVIYLLKSAVKESNYLLRQCVDTTTEEFNRKLVSVPMTSACVSYLSALQNYLLREAVLFKPSDGTNHQVESGSKKTLAQVQSQVLNLADKVFAGAQEVFQVLLEVCNGVINGPLSEREMRFTGLERIAKATLLGHLLPVLVTALTNANLKSLDIANALMSQLVQLVILSSQAALLLKRQSQITKVPDSTKEIPPKSSIGDEKSAYEDFELEKQEELGFLAGLKIPAPWARGCTMESIHPVRDNYKFKETVHIPGARCLYLRFDPRCSSQYDYDKLIVYAGPDASSVKVAEYGGNTYGYGSRSVLGSGWPKDLVKVEGDTVTFAFEMRSGREHNTPDKAMWGFLVSVRAQESTETISSGLPFMADLALGFSVLSCAMLKLLYQGPACSPDEVSCTTLLRSRFLQRCVKDADDKFTPHLSQNIPSGGTVELSIDENMELDTSAVGPVPKRVQHLAPDVLHKLRSLSCCVAPQLRPSIRSVLHVDSLEDKVIAAVLKHAAIPFSGEALAVFQEQADCQQKLRQILSQAYRKLDALIRRLQALAELEQRWQSELEDIRQGMMPASMAFFADYHFSDAKMKELSMLCFLKGVDMEGLSPEVIVHNLREKLEMEAYSKEPTSTLSFSKTRQLVATIFQRAEILLIVSLESDNTYQTPGKHSEGPSPLPDESVASKPTYSRSFSAPSQMTEFALDSSNGDAMSLSQRKRLSGHWGRYSTSILDDMHHEDDNSSTHKVAPPTLLDQLFAIVSNQPERHISVDQFRVACNVRQARGSTRRLSLIHMKELLTAALNVGGATHLVAAVTSVLQNGPKIDELTCGGMASAVREAFSETITSVVQLAAQYPLASCSSIGLLCVVPYTKSEEKCLVQSGLVHLLDRLCSLSNHRSGTSNTDPQNLRLRVAAMAWAGFQVLSNCCVSWENDEEADAGEPGQSGLAQQVATLLTNHLARATDNNGNDMAGNEALQEVLSLLNNLSRSMMGKAILSQPTCVSKLLSLLLDQRPSPKLVLVILQLCRTALPLMSAEDCGKVSLPAWGSAGDAGNLADQLPDVPSQIASLLLAKLGDYVIPGFQTTASSAGSSLVDSSSSCGSVDNTLAPSTSKTEKGRPEEADAQDGRLSVFLYKRTDQAAHDVIQPLIGAESRLFRLSGSGNVDRVERITKDLAKYNRAEVCTEDALSALRRAAKWAQNGMVVSTGSAVDRESTEQNSDKKKITVDVICKEKNAELVKTDPVRAFISGQVANSMASEVIALLHGLLTATTAKIWASAVERVLGDALACIPQLMKQMEIIGGPQCSLISLLHMSRCIVAALCALGGFKTSLKPGSEVCINGAGSDNSPALVVNISEQQGLATVKLCYFEANLDPLHGPDTFQVPLCRLTPRQNEPLPLQRLSLTRQVVEALQAILAPDTGRLPLQSPLPAIGEGNNLAMAICRVVAEIRTRACMVLAQYLKDQSFALAFMQRSSLAVDMLKSLAKDCSPGDRAITVETQCERLRMLYRDCAKPPPPPSKSNGKTKEITWNTTKAFPPVRASLFSHGLTGITFLGDPSAGSGLPRGTFIYASQPIPQQAPSFYWELEVCSLGDPQEDSGPVISFGFAPPGEKKDSAWTNPVGTVLFHNNGRAVHYNGSSLLQWKSVRLDVSLAAGDIAGCGWERVGESPELLGQQAKGTVFFTHNGQRLLAVLEDVIGGLWPVVHIQKKSTRVKANFGVRPFAYADGQHHVNAAHEASESTEEISANFGLLPFPGCSDSESDISERATISSSTDGRDARTPPGPPCRVLTASKPCREYNSEASSLCKLQQSYGNLTSTGPDVYPALGMLESESDVDDADDDQQQEDHYALLVKAWESRVFPVIRRRFRNEAERKDGLEQIRGALQLGMTDIARQTVEFLYEENGGIPRDLHLPTIEDIKEEISRFTMERIKRGMGVIVRNPSTSCTSGTTLLPKFAMHNMLKTFGLLGVVLDIDNQNELVQVETYLRSEGVLVRFWYPLEVLERPPQGLRKTAVTGAQILDTNSVHIHRELLHLEQTLARIYCRLALLELIELCNRPDLPLSKATGSSTAVAASASVFQELDVENLQLLSNSLLAPISANGTVLERRLTTARSLRQVFAADSCLASDLFYSDVTPLRLELASAIHRAASQGEDYLIELTNQIAMCVQLAPENFPHEDVLVIESKVTTDVHFPGASFLIVSCKADLKAAKKEATHHKSPWARIFCYSGNEFKKNGRPSRQEVICYPRVVTSPINVDPAAIGNPYPPVLLACDRIHLKAGCSPAPGIIVTIHALPPHYPLAMAYFEELLHTKWKELPPKRTSGDEESQNSKPTAPPLITSAVLLHVIELLGGYLWRTDIPARLKECMFHLLAELLRTMHSTEDASEDGSIFPALGPQLSPSLTLLLQLQSELRKLYEVETKTWSSPDGAAVEQGRFSSYFHALMEVSLAVAEVTSPIAPALGTAMLLGMSCSGASTGSNSGTAFSVAPPPSPSASSKRKKLKAKRDRDRTSPKSRSGSSSPRSSICEVEQAGPSGLISGSSAVSSPATQIVSGSKAEDVLWFHRALTMSEILRFLLYGSSQGSSVTNDAISDACQSLVPTTAHTRLLAITGIPVHLSDESVKRAINRALRGVGGMYQDEIFVPKYCPGNSDLPHDSGRAGNGALASASKQADAGEKLIQGFAVIEIRSKSMLDSARKALFKSKALLDGGSLELGLMTDEVMDMSDNNLSISTINQNLQLSDPDDTFALESYLKAKLCSSENNGDLTDGALTILTDIFYSCFFTEQHLSYQESNDESGFICLSKDQIMNHMQGNLLYTFFCNIRPPKKSLHEQVSSVLIGYGLYKREDKEYSRECKQADIKQRPKKSALKKSYKERLSLVCDIEKSDGSEKWDKKDEKSSLQTSSRESESQENSSKEGSPDDQHFLTLDGFIRFVSDKAKSDIRATWQSLFACGYDLHFDRCCCTDTNQAQLMSKMWTLEMDCSLVHYVNRLCHHLAITPARLHPHEISLTQTDFASIDYVCLQPIPPESLRLRFALLQSLNNTLETFFLFLIDLRPAQAYPHCTAAILSKARGIIFYDTKITLMNNVLNATALRSSDQAAPEISLDPLEIIGTDRQNVSNTQFCQAMYNLKEISSSQFCVHLATGGDPTFAFNVRLIGEEVYGTSGSFRHFLSQVSRELQSPLLPLFSPCPSAAANYNKGKYILQPGPLLYSEEKMLEFLGQLIGITIRADIPLPLDLIPAFWKSLVSWPLDPISDLQDIDILTYNYIKEFDTVENVQDLSQLLEEHHNPHFVYTSLTGEKVELCPDGQNVPVCWENHSAYVTAIRDLRMRELASPDRYLVIKAGLASIIPVQLFHLLTPSDLELRACGIPEIDLDFLKAHTMYQVGLMETDTHIRFFWNALESLSQEELRRFVKFATNQDRIPSNCPCKDGQSDSVHVPPYPMKIAPPEGRSGSPDSRYIRVETCIFLLKLPQYSSQEIMTERLLYAINCREDPLSG